MISLRLDHVGSVVALAAHPDDLEISAGGLLLLLAEGNPGLRVHYMILTGGPDRHAECRAAAAAFLPRAELSFALHDLPDGRVPGEWSAAKRFVHEASRVVEPDLVLAPRTDDAHQDHRLLGEMATQAFRDHLVLHYEIPKWDGDLGRSNAYVPLERTVASRKVDLLNEHYASQQHHDWWDDEVFLGLMRVRGMECRAPYAEAFRCDKAVLAL